MSRTRVLSWVLLAPLALHGCAPDERAPLSECEHGLYWAECGGEAEPVLGCDRESGDCRWFSGGETAHGYAVSDCPVSEPCCHRGWPFTDFEPSGATLLQVVDVMSLLEHRFVARVGEHDLPVEFGFTEETIPGLVRCAPAPGCMGGGFVARARVGASIVLTMERFRSRWHLEIVTAATREQWSARLYRIDHGSRVGALYPVCNDYSIGREWALTGVLRLNTDDLSDLEALHGRLEGVGEHGEISMEF